MQRGMEALSFHAAEAVQMVPFLFSYVHPAYFVQLNRNTTLSINATKMSLQSGEVSCHGNRNITILFSPV